MYLEYNGVKTKLLLTCSCLNREIREAVNLVCQGKSWQSKGFCEIPRKTLPGCILLNNIPSDKHNHGNHANEWKTLPKHHFNNRGDTKIIPGPVWVLEWQDPHNLISWSTKNCVRQLFTVQVKGADEWNGEWELCYQSSRPQDKHFL